MVTSVNITCRLTAHHLVVIRKIGANTPKACSERVRKAMPVGETHSIGPAIWHWRMNETADLRQPSPGKHFLASHPVCKTAPLSRCRVL